MPDKITLNRFPLFGLFAYRAARRMRLPDETSRLLGYSTALLYAIFKAKSQSQKSSTEKGAEKKMPAEVQKAKTGTIEFGGKEFMAIYDGRKHPSKTVVGHEIQTPDKFDSQIKEKFPEGWYDRISEAFDRYLTSHTPSELHSGNTLFDLYKAWRDECKVGVNRVDLEKLVQWLEEHADQ